MIISKTPLRISLAGGGTDLPNYYQKHNGAVINTAINKYIYVIVKKRFDDKIRISYTKTELVDSVEEIQHDLVREALKLTGITKGIEIITLADIPSEGTGLGSSSTLTVGLLNALYSYLGHSVKNEELAKNACKIELDILKKTIGKQDQYIAAYGGLRNFTFKKDGAVFTELIHVDNEVSKMLGQNLMLFYTGITRSASRILEIQNKNMSQNYEQLKSLKEQCTVVNNLLKKNMLDDLGYELDKGWKLKKTLSQGVSNDFIDQIYCDALQSGAIGGKITGAGGGGFLLLYVPIKYQSQVRENIPLKELEFDLENYGSEIIFYNEELRI
ncbi:hypothetical protein ACIQXF_20085 [Lysinibacillus sp. NPDC097231]|uniref:GHMP family kinase ATP-binding protein n=1 Tax=Lysinibacillus sp. NPDC097231 TaxID=3364142 RepID=UPI0038285C5B